MSEESLKTTDKALNETDKHQISTFRKLIAWFVGGCVTAYTFAVIRGHIPKEHQIDASHFGLIALTFIFIILILNPQYLERLKLLEVSGFKLQMLDKVQDKLYQQENSLDQQKDSINQIYSKILPLLLPRAEIRHLKKLSYGETSNYKGRKTLRAELRRLRSFELIQMVDSKKHIGHMIDGKRFNLAEYVELTDKGRTWLGHIKSTEKSGTIQDQKELIDGSSAQDA